MFALCLVNQLLNPANVCPAIVPIITFFLNAQEKLEQPFQPVSIVGTNLHISL